MAQLELHKETLDQLGVQLIFIAAEKRHGVWQPAKYLAQHPVSFPFLLDEDRSVTRAYGLYHGLDRDAFRIAHPATLVVDRTGLIQHIYVGAGQTDRSDVDTLLAVIRLSVAEGKSP